MYADMGHSLLPFLRCKMRHVLAKYVKTNTFVILLNLLFGFILIVYASTLLYGENIKQVSQTDIIIYKMYVILFVYAVVPPHT